MINNIEKKRGKVYIASFNMRGYWWHNVHNTKTSKRVTNKDIEIINVTSVQGKDRAFRKDFSPMTQFSHHFNDIPSKYENYYCFENYWQGGKVFENVDKKKSDAWWFKQKSGKRRLPVTKGMLIDKTKNWENKKYNGRVLHSVYEKENEGERIIGKDAGESWVMSRKIVYVPEYHKLMKETESFKKIKKYVDEGNDVIIYDIDGPRKNIHKYDSKIREAIKDNNKADMKKYKNLKKTEELDCKKITKKILIEKLNNTKFPFGHCYVVAAGLAGIPLKKYNK